MRIGGFEARLSVEPVEAPFGEHLPTHLVILKPVARRR
jgi:hypothetical protein